MAVPKRELFKAAEVCEMAGIQPYVLRTWEAEFPALGDTGSATGARAYRQPDVELVLKIKQLVFGEGLTLAGARRRLEEDGDGGDWPPEVQAAPAPSGDTGVGDEARVRLREIRSGLQGILDLLDGAAPPELQLVAPEAPRAKTAPAKGRKASRAQGSAGVSGEARQ
ncbi:MAG: MerR family transcriptional regulator [Vicinamibacterales bacterium]